MKKRIILSLITFIITYVSMNPIFAENTLNDDNIKTSLEKTESSETINDMKDGIKLTLEDALNIALQNNPTIEQAKLKLEKSEVEYDKGKSFIRKNEDDIKNKYGENSTTYLEQITKNKISNDLSWEISQKEYLGTVDKQKKEVEKMYFNVLHAQKSLEIQEENLKLAKDFYENTKQKFEIGTVTETDVSNSELNYQKSKKDFLLAQNNLESTKMSLNIILGYDVMNELILIDELDYESFENTDIIKNIDKALEYRTDLLNSQLSYEMKKIDFEVVSRRYPEIVFEYREKEISFKEAEKTLENTKKIIEMDVRNKYSSVENKYESIKISQRSVELAQKVFDNTILSYNIGKALLTDVQQAQIKLHSENLVLAQDILDYNIAILEFDECLGNEIE